MKNFTGRDAVKQLMRVFNISKQDIVTGTTDQVVGFDESGKMIPKTLELNGMTDEEIIEQIQRIIDENPDRFKGESFDAESMFLTAEGLGGLRYYNGHLQSLNSETGVWSDTSVTPDNVYIINMIPQAMEDIYGIYDHSVGHFKLKWMESKDTIIEGQIASLVEKVIIRRKLGSAPIDENDGDFVVEVKRSEFGNHMDDWYTDEGVTPTLGDVYYYKAFPYNTIGFINLSSTNETKIVAKEYVLYCVHIDGNESNTPSMCTYKEDNASFNRPAHMNYDTGKFDYGDWRDAWFIRDLKPVMLKRDGTVDYILDKNDYEKKLDGTPSDVKNTAYDGDAMMKFPKVYWKAVPDEEGGCDFYVSDKLVDENFHCWSHLDPDGNEIDYCYMPIYDGSVVDGRLRSMSGLYPLNTNTRNQEVAYAKAVNLNSDNIWYTGVACDWMLINILLILISKTVDSKTAFGRGNNSTYVSQSNTGIKNSGTLNKKGLFWGNQDNATCVKVFGMENFWGNIWKGIAGWIITNGIQKIKLTYSKKDGSTVDGYNMDGTGYITIPGSTPAGTSSGFLNKILFTQYGFIPKEANGAETTYYRVGFRFNNSIVAYMLVGGNSFNASRVGGLCPCLGNAVSLAGWGVGASISCKPRAVAK